MALLWALPATLLFLSATASQVVMTPDGSHERENSDVRNNLVETYEGVSAVTSGSLHEPYTPRPRQERAQRENSASPFKKPQARTLSIPSFLGGEKETEDNQAATTPNIGEIAPLNDHPLWKVHKYQGIDLSPVLLPTAYGPPSESYGTPAETYGPPAKIYGPPAETFGTPAQKYGPPAETYGPPAETYGPPAQRDGPTQPSHPSEPYSPPTDTYGPPESSVSATPDTTAALSALDSLSGLVSLLPEEGQKNSPSLSALNSLATLLPQKSNSGLSLEQLSALASLVSLLQAKSNGAPASTYGPPNTRGSEISSLVSLVKVLPSETTSSYGSLLARLQSLSRRRPSFLHKLLNALNLARPSENKGTNPDADVANVLHLPDLPPVTIPANYKFQETGVGRPYIVKFSKSVPSTLPDSTYVPPQQNPVLTYGAPSQLQEEGSLYPPLHVSSQYGTPNHAPTSFGPQQETSSFQPAKPDSQQGFTSYQTPTFSYPTSVQEPGSFINSYGQPAAQYSVLPAETDHKNSNFQTQSQNPSYNNAAQTSTTDTSAIQSAYSVLQQNQNQPQVEGPSVDIGTHQFAQSGPYLQQSYPPSRSDLFHGTSRSDTNIPPDDLPSKRDDDFRPSTLAAATGSGYSRVAFQRSQHQDTGLANQPRGELEFVTTSTSDIPQLNSDADASMSHAPSATSTEDSELLKENVFRQDSKKFLAGNR